jgi:alpha-glucosidase
MWTVLPFRPMPETPDQPAWWRHAVIYQVYPRSFADADGDGLGDLAGIRAHLPYIRDLGVDAIWINPWYPSPMADAGYDVADYRDIDPMFGTLAEAEALIAEARGLGLRVLLDIVPNHTSSAHPWFRAALSAAPGSHERHRYLFRPGRGDGSLPPNDWESVFGGSAWSRIVEPDGSPGEWYLHLFDLSQPDLNWDEPEVHAEFESILRFWFDRGVDGFRIDVANALHKQPDLPDLAGRSGGPVDEVVDDHPFWDRDTVHEVYREWRRVADGYPDPKMFVAEAWVPTPERLARYVRPDHLHSAFNFDFLATPWRANLLRQSVDEALVALGEVSAQPTWVLSNHDVVRVVSRLGVSQPNQRQWHDVELDPSSRPDLRLGLQRARAAALLMLALPGGAYVYQGEELGLWEVLDIPDDALQDPIWERSGRTRRGRDGARVPMPWTEDGPSLGFGPPDGAPPWLPQPADYAGVAVERQQGDPDSMLELYRRALRIRREHPGFASSSMRWLESPKGVLVFEREHGLVVVVNVEGSRIDLPAHREVLLASTPLDELRLPPNSAVWLRT